MWRTTSRGICMGVWGGAAPLKKANLKKIKEKKKLTKPRNLKNITIMLYTNGSKVVSFWVSPALAVTILVLFSQFELIWSLKGKFDLILNSKDLDPSHSSCLFHPVTSRFIFIKFEPDPSRLKFDLALTLDDLDRSHS